jgi:hypothetical protein
MTMTATIFRAIDAFAMAILCAISASTMWFVLQHLDDRPPVEYADVRVVTPQPVEADTQILVEYKQRRNRACPSDIYGWWIDLHYGTADMRLPMVHGGYSLVADDWYWQAVKLMAPPRAGNWQYRVNIISFCEQGTYVSVPPAVRVTVQ